ncbi:lysyl oxidase homolog 3A-like [Saccoglossus kowalevskii]|uniref:Lysyl oxidase homolog 2-like n=1 Tax=Saccoglossus kowalevskii TaxID=10224 RepID=A0ABM0H1W8_SACKO|nr:PREDICTED: lysyl oxidase homolog 2-like [Saccoglossus kowalevskii]
MELVCRPAPWLATIAMVVIWTLSSNTNGQSIGNDEDLKIQLRLMDGRSIYEGRVEIFVNDEMGTICDDYFTLTTANVICKDLGFAGAESFYYGGHFNPGTGRIWLDSLRCDGNESSIKECSHAPWGVTDCSHDEDVGVRCKSSMIANTDFEDSESESNQLTSDNEDSVGRREHGPMRVDLNVGSLKVRLRGRRTAYPKSEGYVEVYFRNRWRPVCADGWDMADSRVVCGQMGFSEAIPIKLLEFKDKMRTRMQNAWLTNVTCRGVESTLQECSYHTLSNAEQCISGMPATARCERGHFVEDSRGKKTDNVLSEYLGDDAILQKPIVRLKSGPYLGSGRVEVFYDGKWGTVCGDSWNMASANVICRELGFGTAKEISLSSDTYGQGTRNVWLDKVNCTGDENSIFDCPHSTWNYAGESLNGFCTHANDAGVVCHVPGQRGLLKIRLVGGRTEMEGRLEVQHGTTWGSVCSDEWDMRSAMVACRQLGLGFAHQPLRDVTYFGGLDVPIIMSGVSCRGDELSLNQCKHDGWHTPKCDQYHIAGVVCSTSLPDLVPDLGLIESTAYIDERPFGLLQCAMEENCVSSSAYDVIPGTMPFIFGTRRLLRFSSSIANRGTSDFIPVTDKRYWEWHQCHQHHHSMEVFATYDLLNSEGYKVAEGHKASFCLEDTHCDIGVSKHYSCLNYGDQGISVNCIDEYKHTIDCQWIDISDIEPGFYILRVHVNPNVFVAESDYSNNDVLCNLAYNGYEISVNNCRFASEE